MLSSAAATPSDPLEQLYQALADLREQIHGPYYLADVDGSLEWPDRGVYVFFSPNSDLRGQPPANWRLSRIGTVGVSDGSSNTLWNRLRQHRGNVRGKYADGGNHRGSIFRLHVGRALIEQRVSEYIRELPFLWVDVPGEPGPESDRATIERNLIALVSHYRRTADPSDLDWLGYHSPKSEVYQSGLWNVQHVSELFDPTVLDLFAEYISSTRPLAHQSSLR